MSRIMDTTFTSVTGGPENGYVSCIKVDGVPILPPLMTEERRDEMRSYKQKAINIEQQLQIIRNQRLTGLKPGKVTVATPLPENKNDPPFQSNSDPTSGEDFVTAPGSPILRTPFPATSTPSRPERVKVKVTTDGDLAHIRIQSNPDFTEQPVSPEAVPVLREQNIARLPIPSHVARRSLKYSNSGGSKSPADVIDVVNDDRNSSNCESTTDTDTHASSDENQLTSSASSTGTFIIDRGNTDAATAALIDASKAALERLELKDKEQQGKKKTENSSARDGKSRRSVADESYFRRKRPAKYFDFDDDNEKENSAAAADCIDSDDYSNIPNAIPVPQPHNNSATAASKSQISLIKNHPMWFSGDPSKGIPINKNVDSEFSLKLNAMETDTNSAADSSEIKNEREQGENNAKNVTPSSGGRKHVRKLSYTVETPSAALLESVAKENSKFAIPLDPLLSSESSPGSGKHGSVNSTPDKQQNQLDNCASFAGDSQTRINLSNRFELERSSSSQKGKSDLTSSPDQIELVLKKMQEAHQQKLNELAENHRIQEQKIKEEFESQLESFRSRLQSSASASDSDKSLGESITLSSAKIGTSARQSQSSPTLSGRPTTASSGMYSSREDAPISVAASTSSSISRLFAVPTTEPLDLATVGLSKLQGRMQQHGGRSSSLFRNPADVRSPILKGIVFPDPLEKSARPIRIPMKAFEPEMKAKFDKISASVKGYLTRRLLNTERVQIIVQTIRDTVDLLLKLYEEVPESEMALLVRPQDTELHQRLVQQLTSACQSFHDVFFKLATKEKMAIIATDRDKQKAKAMRRLMSPIKHSISNATLRSIERRKSFQLSPKKKDSQQRRFRPSNTNYGSQSVNPKPINKSNMISPKRRRISYWDGRSLGRSSSATTTGEFANRHDLNGNNFVKPSNSSQSRFRPSIGPTRNFQFSNIAGAAGNLNTNAAAAQQTFIVASPYTSNPSSSRSSRSSMSLSNSGSLRYSRVSSSRQPWK